MVLDFRAERVEFKGHPPESRRERFMRLGRHIPIWPSTLVIFNRNFPKRVSRNGNVGRGAERAKSYASPNINAGFMEKIKNNSSKPKPQEPKDKVRKVMIVVGVGRIAMKKPDTKSASQ
jgi:hypothetical protein